MDLKTFQNWRDSMDNRNKWACDSCCVRKACDLIAKIVGEDDTTYDCDDIFKLSKDTGLISEEENNGRKNKHLRFSI